MRAFLLQLLPKSPFLQHLTPGRSPLHISKIRLFFSPSSADGKHIRPAGFFFSRPLESKRVFANLSLPCFVSRDSAGLFPPFLRGLFSLLHVVFKIPSVLFSSFPDYLGAVRRGIPFGFFDRVFPPFCDTETLQLATSSLEFRSLFQAVREARFVCFLGVHSVFASSCIFPPQEERLSFRVTASASGLEGGSVFFIQNFTSGLSSSPTRSSRQDSGSFSLQSPSFIVFVVEMDRAYPGPPLTTNSFWCIRPPSSVLFNYLPLSRHLQSLPPLLTLLFCGLGVFCLAYSVSAVWSPKVVIGLSGDNILSSGFLVFFLFSVALF